MVSPWGFQLLYPASPPPKGKDLGLAFEIPAHLKNQALFPACVLKVRTQPEESHCAPSCFDGHCWVFIGWVAIGLRHFHFLLCSMLEC